MENEKPKIIVCSFCDTDLSLEEIEKNSGTGTRIEYLCDKCTETTSFCYGCGKRFTNTEMYRCEMCGDENVCESCKWWCDDCDTYCCGETCYENHRNDHDNDDSFEQRAWRELPQTIESIASAKEGAIVKSKRPFGIELECYYPDIDVTSDVYAAIHKNIGITDDGSLGSRGIEYQTPPACGDEAEKIINMLCGALDKHGYSVDTSCGYHLHIDGSDIMRSYSTLKKLWLFYYAFDDVLLAMLPASRRNNRYCKALRKSYGYTKILEADSRERLEALWYDEAAYTGDELADKLQDHKSGKYDDTRYNGLNFHSLWKDGHLEVRYHSGTINTKKILEWANIHCRIHDKIKDINIGDIQRALNSVLLAEKTQMFFDLLNLSTLSRKYIMDRIKLFSPLAASSEETNLKGIQ